MLGRIKSGFTPAQATLYSQQFEFFNRLIDISGLAKAYKKEERKGVITQYLKVGGVGAPEA